MSKKYLDWLSPEGLNRVRGWARDGLTQVEIAEKMGITRNSLKTWKDRFPDFKEAIEKGKEHYDNKVVETLHRCATGYHYRESETLKDKDGNMIQEKTFNRYAKPDITALIFWLKNRRPDLWRNVQQISVSAGPNVEKQVEKVAEYLSQGAPEDTGGKEENGVNDG